MVADEPSDAALVGQEVVLPGTALVFTGRAFVRIDNRTVSVTRVPAGVDLEVWAAEGMSAFFAADGRCFMSADPAEAVSLPVAARRMSPGPAAFAGLRGPVTMPESIKVITTMTGEAFLQLMIGGWSRAALS